MSDSNKALKEKLLSSRQVFFLRMNCFLRLDMVEQFLDLEDMVYEK